jgi:predicted ATPase
MAEALALASSAMQAHSRAWSAVYAALLHQLLGDAGATRRYAEIAIGACERQGIPHFRAQAEFLKGWSLAVAGDRRTGTAAMEQALAQLDVLGNRPMLPYFLTVHAEMLASAGRADEALGRVEVALAECAASKQSWCTAEIHRVRGTILGRPDEACLPLAEAELRMACEIARNQGAVAWERRAVSSLADLWMRSGRADEARALLSCLPPITGAEAGVGAASGCC